MAIGGHFGDFSTPFGDFFIDKFAKKWGNFLGSFNLFSQNKIYAYKRLSRSRQLKG